MSKQRGRLDSEPPTSGRAQDGARRCEPRARASPRSRRSLASKRSRGTASQPASQPTGREPGSGGPAIGAGRAQAAGGAREQGQIGDLCSGLIGFRREGAFCSAEALTALVKVGAAVAAAVVAVPAKVGRDEERRNANGRDIVLQSHRKRRCLYYCRRSRCCQRRRHRGRHCNQHQIWPLSSGRKNCASLPEEEAGRKVKGLVGDGMKADLI